MDHESYSSLYRATIPSVASIYATADGGPRAGAGSGFVYDPEHVVTNHHVVSDGESVELRFADGEWRVGRVVGTDPYTDLAAVRVPDLPDSADPLPLADEPPAPGAPVAALGNPMGLDGSITAGIVSGANRSMATGPGFTVPDVVQTDAAINPGNSGGPLVTLDGAVVGVNRARAGDNIGFAVSAAVVDRVVPALVEDGRYRHPYLRVRTLDVSPSVAAANDLDEARGVLVVHVADGPASGRLRACDRTVTVRGRELPAGGDVVVAVDGERVDSHEELLRHLLLETEPDQEVTVDLLRDGRERTERVTLAQRPGDRRGRDRRSGGRNIPVR